MPNFDSPDFDYEDDPNMDTRIRGRKLMVKTTKKINPKKPSLVLMGEHMIDPTDVACIKKVRSKDDLYIVVLKSQPNMEFPMWANGEQVAMLVKHFNIVG